jgi:hypothetical protein
MLQEVAGREIADFGTVSDGLSKQFDIFTFKIQIGLKQRLDVASLRILS